MAAAVEWTNRRKNIDAVKQKKEDVIEKERKSKRQKSGQEEDNFGSHALSSKWEYV